MSDEDDELNVDALTEVFEAECTSHLCWLSEQKKDPTNQLAHLGLARQRLESLLHTFRSKLPSSHFMPVLLNLGDQLRSLSEYIAAKELGYLSCFEANCAAIRVRARYGAALCTFNLARMADPRVKFPYTLGCILESLREIQAAMKIILDSGAAEREAMYWLLFNGSVHLYEICQPLLSLGFAQHIVEFFSWSVLCLEAVVSLCTVKYLPWRTRQYVAIVHCFEELSNHAGALAACQRGQTSIERLRLEELEDPPIPPSVLSVIDRCQDQLSVLKLAVDFRTIKELTPMIMMEQLDSHFAQRDSIKMLVLTESLQSPSRRALCQAAAPADSEARIAITVSVLMELVAPALQNTFPDESFFPLAMHCKLMKWLFNYGFVEEAQLLLSSAIQRCESLHNAPTISNSYSWLVQLEISVMDSLLSLEYFDATPEGPQRKILPDRERGDPSPTDPLSQLELDEVGEQELVEPSARSAGDGDDSSPPVAISEVDFGDEDAEGDPDTKVEDALSGNPGKIAALTLEEVEIGEVNGRKIPIPTLLRLAALLVRGMRSNDGAACKLRPDFLSDAAMRLWSPYCTSIMDFIGEQPAQEVLSPRLLSVALRCITAVHLVLSKVDLDDPVLRSTVALKLGLLMVAGQDYRSAVQVLRCGLLHVASARAQLVSQELSPPSCLSERAILSRSAICTASDLASSDVGLTPIDSLELTLASLHTDLCCTLMRTELLLGIDISQRSQHHSRLLAARRRTEARKREELSGGRRKGARSQVACEQEQQSDALTHNSSSHTEAKLTQHARHSPCLRALLKMQIASFRAHGSEQNTLLQEAASELRRADFLQQALLADSQRLPNELQTRLPPAPIFVSRTATTITMRADVFIPRGLPSTTVSYYVMYAKPAGAGTDVSLNNVHLPGTGVAMGVPAWHRDLAARAIRRKKSKRRRRIKNLLADNCCTITIRGLVPNETYVFAVAAFDSGGSVIRNIGATSIPVLSAQPLPLLLCWGYLAQTACKLLSWNCARDSAAILYKRFIQVHPRKPMFAGNPLNRCTLDLNRVACTPPTVLLAFVHSLFILVDNDAQGGDALRGLAGVEADQLDAEASLVPSQLAALRVVQTLMHAMQISSALNSHSVVLQCVSRMYNSMLPLLRLPKRTPLLIPALTMCHQALRLVPVSAWNPSIQTIFACVSYELEMHHRHCGEAEAGKFVLLTTGPEDMANHLRPALNILGISPPVPMCGLLSLGPVVARNTDALMKSDSIEEEEDNSTTRRRKRKPKAAKKKATPNTTSTNTTPSIARPLGTEHFPPPVAEQEALVEYLHCFKEYSITGTERLNVAAGILPLFENEENKETDDESKSATRKPDRKSRREREGKSREQSSSSSTPSTRLWHMVYSANGGVAKAFTMLQKKFVNSRRYLELICRLCRHALGLAKTSSRSDGSGAVVSIGQVTSWLDEASKVLPIRSLTPLSRDVLTHELGGIPETARPLVLAVFREQQEEAEDVVDQVALSDGGGSASEGEGNEHKNDALNPVDIIEDDPDLGPIANPASNDLIESKSAAPNLPRPTLLQALRTPSSQEQQQLLWLAEIELLRAECRFTRVAGDGRYGADPGAGPCTDLSRELCDDDITGLEREHVFPDDFGIPQQPGETIEAPAVPPLPLSGANEQAEPDEETTGEGLERKEIEDREKKEKRKELKRNRKRGNALGGTEHVAALSENKLEALQALVIHCARSAGRARWGHAWKQLGNASRFLWNALWHSWVSPKDFIDLPEADVFEFPQIDTKVSVDGSSSLAGAEGESSRPSSPSTAESVSGVESSRPPSSGGKGKGKGLDWRPLFRVSGYLLDMVELRQNQSAPPLHEDFRSGEHDLFTVFVPHSTLSWIAKFITFTIQTLCFLRLRHELVSLGNRLISLTGSEFAEPVLPLMIHAKRQLWRVATARHQVAAQELATFERERADSLARRKKRRRRLVSDGPTPDEIRYQQGWVARSAVVAERALRAEAEGTDLASLEVTHEDILRDKSVALESLHSCRRLLDQISSSEHSEPSVSVGAPAEVVAGFEKTVVLLRRRREMQLLQQALQELGDFHCSRGTLLDAAKAWSDAIDAAFGTVDAAHVWRDLFAGVHLLSICGLWGCLLSATALHKLARYTCNLDLSLRLEYSFMASHLLAAPFSASLPHPTRPCGFASYRTRQIWPGIDSTLLTDNRRLKPMALLNALHFSATQLLLAEEPLQALPLLSAFEYFACDLCSNLAGTVHARVLMVAALTKLGFISQATVVLAQLYQGSDLPGISYATNKTPAIDSTPVEGSGRRNRGQAKDESKKPLMTTLSPFSNERRPNHPENYAALVWLTESSNLLSPKLQALYGILLSNRVTLARAQLLLSIGSFQNLPFPVTIPDPEPAAPADEPADDSLSPGTPIRVTILQTASQLAETLQSQLLSERERKNREMREAKAKADAKTARARARQLAREARLREEAAKEDEPSVEEDDHRKKKQKASSSKPSPRQPGSSRSNRGDASTSSTPRTKTEQESKAVLPTAKTSPGQSLAILPPLTGVELYLWAHAAILRAESAFEMQSFLESATIVRDVMHLCSVDSGHPGQGFDRPSFDEFCSVVDLGLPFWLRCRAILASCLLQQGQLEQAQAQCTQGIAEAEALQERTMRRQLTTLNSIIDMHAGNILAAVSKLKSLLEEKPVGPPNERVVALVLLGDLEFSSCQLQVTVSSDALQSLVAVEQLYAEAEQLTLQQLDNCGWQPFSALSNVYLPGVTRLSEISLRLGCVKAVLAASAELHDRGSAQGQALAVVERGLSALKHACYMPPMLQARLLASVGVLRAQTLAQHLPANGRQFVLGSQLTLSSPDGLEALLDAAIHPPHPFTGTVAALQSAIAVSVQRGGHDTMLLHTACMQLVSIFGSRQVAGMEIEHTQIATHYLRAAARSLQARAHLLNGIQALSQRPLEETALAAVPSHVSLELSQFPPDDRTSKVEAAGHSVTLTPRQLLYYFLGLWNELDVCSFYTQTQATNIVLMHTFLRDHYEPYAQWCCLSTSVVDAASEEPEIPPGLVCVQWFDPGAAFSRSTARGHDLLPENLSMFYLLGPVPNSHTSDFEYPVLQRARLDIGSVHRLQLQFSSLRCSLEDAGHMQPNPIDMAHPDPKGGKRAKSEKKRNKTTQADKDEANPLSLPESAQQEFARLIQLVQGTLSSVTRDLPCTTPLSCTMERVCIFESLLNTNSGVDVQDEEMCVWLRGLLGVTSQ